MSFLNQLLEENRQKSKKIFFVKKMFLFKKASLKKKKSVLKNLHHRPKCTEESSQHRTATVAGPDYGKKRT